MNRKTVHGWLTECSLVRRAAEALFRASSHRHMARFDRQAPARCQTRILLGLLHQARNTRFGREHDFRRIRTVEDFRRLVPLCTRTDLWRQYWQPVYPHLAGTTWPEEDDKVTRRQGDKVTDDSSVTLSPCHLVALSSSHREALRTAFALVARVRPRTPLFSGALLLPGDEGPSSVWERGNLIERLPALVRPYARLGDESLAESYAHLPVTCLIGTAECLLPLLENVKQFRGKRQVKDVWSGLSAILFTRRSPDAAARLRAEAEGALLLEMAGRGEGPIAVEDPQHGLMRLLFDHGVYFEFVPLDRANEAHCPRYGIEEIEVGVPYELALSSPAGLWACRVGRTVCLERRDPPLVRFLEPAVAQPPVAEKRRPRRTDLILPTLLEAELHPQNGDSPAAPPESSFRSPWSTRADRG